MHKGYTGIDESNLAHYESRDVNSISDDPEQ